MNKQKVVFIIPGFRQKPTSNAYQKLGAILKSEGYIPILISIPWSKSTISENTKYFLKEYKKVKAGKKYILGFSFGAMIAFIAATKVNSNGIILCSLSPYFQEDIAITNNRAVSRLMATRYMDFSKLQCSLLAKRLKTKQIFVLYGMNEAKALISRARKAFTEIESVDKKLIKIKKTEHNIGNKKYLHGIHYAARLLQ